LFSYLAVVFSTFYIQALFSYLSIILTSHSFSLFFFFTLLLPPRSTLFPYNDALPISLQKIFIVTINRAADVTVSVRPRPGFDVEDRKSTRLNSSHEWISYAVFCLKKKKKKTGRQVRSYDENLKRTQEHVSPSLTRRHW